MTSNKTQTKFFLHLESSVYTWKVEHQIKSEHFRFFSHGLNGIKSDAKCLKCENSEWLAMIKHKSQTKICLGVEIL